jgi:hypothetical protein
MLRQDTAKLMADKLASTVRPEEHHGQTEVRDHIPMEILEPVNCLRLPLEHESYPCPCTVVCKEEEIAAALNTFDPQHNDIHMPPRTRNL